MEIVEKTSCGIPLGMESKTTVHLPSNVQQTYQRKDQPNKNGRGLRGSHLSLETTLLKPTSFADELYSQVENSSTEVIRKLFIAIQ